MIKVRILSPILEGNTAEGTNALEGHINRGLEQLFHEGVADEDILEVYPYNANNQYYYTIITYRAV